MSNLKKFEMTFLFFTKVLLCAVLFAAFFVGFGMFYPELLHLTKAAGVTMLTFGALSLLLTKIYGGFPLGMKRGRPSIRSMVLVAFLTDLVTYFQFCIARINNTRGFYLSSPYLLGMVFLSQIVLLYGVAWLGNLLYYKLTPPARACVIAASQNDFETISKKISNYAERYELVEATHYTDAQVGEMIDRNQVIFLSGLPVEVRERFMKLCYEQNKKVYYNLEFGDIITLGGGKVMFGDTTLVTAYPSELSFEQRAVKRGMDILLSALVLTVFSPLMLLCAAAIKLDDGGKVFFRQKRATRDEKVFEVYKFRTMKEETQANRSATVDDDRITRVGRFLRKFRLDELPQFLNILKGEMSVVGPRPEMLENVEKYTAQLPEFRYRLKVKAGLTGYAQIYGKYNTSPKDKLDMDLTYIETYSVWQDVKLLFITVSVFFKASESTEAFEKENHPGIVLEQFGNTENTEKKQRKSAVLQRETA